MRRPGSSLPLLLFALAELAALPAPGQAPPAAPSAPQARSFSLGDFLAEVERANLDLAAARFDIPVAAAQITLARLVPDPQLTAGIDAYDLTSQRLPTATAYGLSQTVELGGKRRARVGGAQAGLSLAEAQLADFFQTLRMNAANAYIDALAAHQVLERKQRTLAGAEQLVTATEQRLRAGDVSPAALWQVKVETERFRSEVFAAEGDVQVADYALELFLGPPRAGEPAHVQATGSLGIAARAFTAEELVAQALAVRSDLVVSLRAVDVARAQVDLAQANRWVDPSLNATLTEAPADPRAGAPASRTAGLSVSLPMPFSRRTHGELDAARAAVQKAETQAQAARRRVEIEVREALARYEATRRSVAVYTGEVLTNADRALEATRYSYERGAARLIELLDAQRTVDDVYLGYTGALADHAKALVALDRAAGRWEAPF